MQGEERREMAEGGATGVGELEGMLENLRALSGEVTTAAVLSEDGELRASTLPPGVDRERYAAMLAALAGIARRTARENGSSGFGQARVRAEEGHILLVGLEGGGTLAATTGPDARVGLVLYDMRNARREVERVLGLGDGDHGDDASEVGGPGERKQ
jgi:predicted regulator of Ras-like GTPase activity (Roadblock/LC7/MglB family)